MALTNQISNKIENKPIPFKGESLLNLYELLMEIEMFWEENIMMLEFRNITGNVIERFNLGKEPRRQRYKSGDGPGYYIVDIYGTRIDCENVNQIRVIGTETKTYNIDSEFYEKIVIWWDGLDKKVR
jgi:hypothetical protein